MSIIENKNTRKYNISINSYDRDITKYLNDNKYSIELDEPLYGIESIELVQAIIPNSEFIINEDNNRLDIIEDEFEITKKKNSLFIPIGTYNISQFVAAINTQYTNIADNDKNYNMSFTNPVVSSNVIRKTQVQMSVRGLPIMSSRLQFNSGINKDRTFAKMLGYFSETDVYTLSHKIYPKVNLLTSSGVSSLVSIDYKLSSKGNNTVPTVSVINGGAGSGASFECVVTDGGIMRIIITNSGNGYTSIPDINIIGYNSDGSRNNTANAYATINGNNQIDEIYISNGGNSFIRPPTIEFVSKKDANGNDIGSGAIAIAIIGDKIVSEIRVLNGGSNYSSLSGISFNNINISTLIGDFHTYIDVSPNRYNFIGPQYLFMSLGNGIDNFGNIVREGKNYQNTQRFFANIDFENAKQVTSGVITTDVDYTYYNKDKYRNIYYFNKGYYPTIKKLDIAFYKSYDNVISLYNFNNFNHTIKLEIVAHVDKSWSKKIKRENMDIQIIQEYFKKMIENNNFSRSLSNKITEIEGDVFNIKKDNNKTQDEIENFMSDELNNIEIEKQDENPNNNNDDYNENNSDNNVKSNKTIKIIGSITIISIISFLFYKFYYLKNKEIKSQNSKQNIDDNSSINHKYYRR